MTYIDPDDDDEDHGTIRLLMTEAAQALHDLTGCGLPPATPDEQRSKADMMAGYAIFLEVDRARRLHNHSLESFDDDERLRVLTEEVGEVARAIEDIVQAERRRYEGSKVRRTPWLEGARMAVHDARVHLIEEVVQVAATALRWVAAENGVTLPRDGSFSPCDECDPSFGCFSGRAVCSKKVQ